MESKKTILALVLVIIVLSCIMSYLFVVKPKIDKFALDNQIKGYNIAVKSLFDQLDQDGYVTVRVENQTFYLVPYNPQQNTGGTQ